MKVLLLNGSAKRNGCTNEALSEIASVLEGEGISAEIFHIGTDAICDCTAAERVRISESAYTGTTGK